MFSHENLGSVLEWSAFTIGTIGTLLWAIEYKYKEVPVESIFWLLSSILWIGYAVLFSIAGLALRDLIGVALYLLALTRIFISYKNKNRNK